MSTGRWKGPRKKRAKGMEAHTGGKWEKVECFYGPMTYFDPGMEEDVYLVKVSGREVFVPERCIRFQRSEPDADGMYHDSIHIDLCDGRPAETIRSRARQEEYEFHRKALERFENMSHDEKLATFIDAGILDEDGKLAERYKSPEDKLDQIVKEQELEVRRNEDGAVRAYDRLTVRLFIDGVDELSHKDEECLEEAYRRAKKMKEGD